MNDRGAIRVLPDPAAVAGALADAFVAGASAAIAQRGRFSVALSGGTTPRAAYELLAAPPRRDRVDWPNVDVYFGDERCVPPDDPASNYRMAREALLDAVPVASGNVHRMRGEIDPGHAANEYASMLRAQLGGSAAFDLILLGMGEDGHTASLFPGRATAVDGDTLVCAVITPSQAMWRITITPVLINAARSVLFAVEGSAKASILATVYAGPLDPVRLPAQYVRPASGQLTWLVDEAAARDLPNARAGPGATEA